MADFIPQKDSELILWLTNLRDKIPTYQVQLGLTAAQVTAIQASCDNVIDKINATAAAKAAFQSAAQDKNNTKKTEVDSLRKTIARAKTESGYTTTIGQDLDIIGEDTLLDPLTYKPKLSGNSFPGYVQLTFTKLGVDGVNVYARLKGETVWVKLAFDSSSPYIDNRAIQPNNPETREYSAIGVIDDNEFGQRSDIVEVTFGG